MSSLVCDAATQTSRDQTLSCDVLVVGGGLGGLALAMGLQKLGLDFRLREAAEELRTATGTLIGLGSNSNAALNGISPDIVPKLGAVAQQQLRLEAHLRPKEQEWQVRKTTLTDGNMITLRWAATQEVLADLVGQEHLLCSHRCIGFSEPEGKEGWVTVHFQDQPDIRARFVIAADGVRSAIRSSMLPDDRGPRYLGHMNWNAVRHVPGSSTAQNADVLKTISDSDAAEGFSTLVYLINAGCDYEFWQVRMQYDEPAFTVPGRPGGGGVPGSKARVLQRLKDLGWQDAAEAVEATDESLIFERAMVDRVPLTSWSSASKRVVLLGDAAHAMHSGPGQGARSAFEDADQLLVALKQHWPDVPAVVEQYEAARIVRATTIQYYAAAGCGLRDLRKVLQDCWAPGAALDREARMERGSEFLRWLISYPDHVEGLPDGKFTTPDQLQAFREAAAAATAEHMRSKDVELVNSSI